MPMKFSSLFFVLAFVAATCLHSQEAAEFKLVLTSPLEHQVFQRTSAQGGKILVAGRIHLASKETQTPEALRVRVTGEGSEGKWVNLVIDSQVAAFRGELEAPAGGWYGFEAEVLRAGKAVAKTAVAHVGMGEVFVIAGQSNAGNYGEEKLVAKTGKVAAFTGSSWQPANDPQPGAGGNGGSFLPAFGDAMVEKFGVPIGLVSTAAGGTSVREWLPPGVRFSNPPTVTGRTVVVGRGAYESDGALYANLLSRLRPLGREGFRAVLWHQGESDANQADPSRTLPGDAYRTFLETLMASAQRDLGSKAPWFVAQTSYHVPGDERSPDIRLAQRMTWENATALEGPDTDTLTGDHRERGGQGVHLSGKGQREHARLWVEKVAPWVEATLAGKVVKKSYVRLSPLFSEGMILQRDRPVPVWGKASAGEELVVEFAGQMKTTKADATGSWKVILDPLVASAESRDLVIRGREETRQIGGVLVGEVWLASGQSNMHWTFSPGQTVARNEEELAAANDPIVRQFTVKKGGAAAPAEQVTGIWHRASRNDLLTGGTSGDSALAYFFARELKAALGVPVGMINASVGGTPIEQWSPGGGLYHAMVHPVAPFPIRGAIWYQGESNCMKPDGPKYTQLQNGMIEAWRKHWGDPALPFLFVQIAPYRYSNRPGGTLTTATLPEFWMAQTATLTLPHTGMVVITDITGNPGDIHPRNKQDVGKRLALQAMAKAYGKTDLVHSGPIFREAKPEEGALRVSFDHTGGGLITADGKAPSHLEIAGADGNFVAATGTIEGNSLIVRSDAVPAPVTVRYAWHEEAMPNLKNREGLPAAPFHSEKWPLKQP